MLVSLISLMALLFCVPAAPDGTPSEIQFSTPCPFVLSSPLSSDRSPETGPLSFPAVLPANWPEKSPALPIQDPSRILARLL